MDLTGKPDPFEALLRQELSPGEHLLWHARAVPRAKRGTLPLVLFAIPWTAFALFWTYMAFTMTREAPVGGLFQWIFPAFGLPFVAVGLSLFARPLLSRIAAGRTAYGVTNRRVIQLMQGKGVIAESVLIERIGSVTRRERSDGSGSLQLSLTAASPFTAGQRQTGFDLGEVPDVRRAEQAVRQAMDRSARQQ